MVDSVKDAQSRTPSVSGFIPLMLMTALFTEVFGPFTQKQQTFARRKRDTLISPP